MSRDPVLIDSTNNVRYSYARICNQASMRGKAHGVCLAADFVVEKSLQLFRAGQDKEAIILRTLAQELRAGLASALTEEADRYERDSPAAIG